MSRFRASTSTGHRIERMFSDCYQISWTVDRYYRGSRLRHPTTYSRETDERGARRFAKKWSANMPDE